MSDRSSLLHLDDRAVAAAVKAAVARTHGDYGAALCSIRFCGEGKMIHSKKKIVAHWPTEYQNNTNCN